MADKPITHYLPGIAAAVIFAAILLYALVSKLDLGSNSTSETTAASNGKTPATTSTPLPAPSQSAAPTATPSITPVAVATATPAPEYTATPKENSSPSENSASFTRNGRVINDYAILYSAPDPDSEDLYSLFEEQSIQINHREHPNSPWYNVTIRVYKSTLTGWVHGNDIEYDDKKQ